LTVGQARSVTVTDDETYTVNGARTVHVSGGMTTENFDQGLTTTVAADGEMRTSKIGATEKASRPGDSSAPSTAEHGDGSATDNLP
jgi:hypothetical protein